MERDQMKAASDLVLKLKDMDQVVSELDGRTLALISGGINDSQIQALGFRPIGILTIPE